MGAEIMKRYVLYPFFIACLLNIGCAALFTEQGYVLIDQEVRTELIFSGVVFSLPEKEDIRKIVILGSGTIQNIDIYARGEESKWKFIKKIKRAITFPFEVPLRVQTDAIRIAQRSTTGKGNIDMVQFYTVVNKTKEES